MKYNAQDRKLNLFDMIFAVVLKWRSIVLMAVILAVLAAGYSYYSSTKQGEAINNASNETIDLSESDELMISRYAEYYDLYLSQKKYCEESPYMTLDANNHYEGRVQYYVQMEEGGTEAEQNAIVTAYEQLLSSEDFYQKVEDIIGNKVSRSYYGEVIDCSKELEKLVFGNDSYEQTEFVDGMVVISVRQAEEEVCRALLDIIVKEIRSGELSVGKQIKKHSLIEMSQTVCVKSDNVLLTLQKLYQEKLATYNAQLATLENQLTEVEVAYAKTLIDGQDSQIQEKESESQPAVMNYKPSVNKKMTVLGFLGGGFLGVVLYAFLYLISSCLRINDNFFESQGIRVLGYLSDEKKKGKGLFSFIDRYILRLRYRMIPTERYEDTISLIVANIAIMCKKADKHSVTITRSGCCENEKKVLDKISEGLEKKGISSTKGNSIACDLQSLEDASQSGLVVLVETVNKTTCYEAQTEIEASRENGMKVLGVVMLVD